MLLIITVDHSEKDTMTRLHLVWVAGLRQKADRSNGMMNNENNQSLEELSERQITKVTEECTSHKSLQEAFRYSRPKQKPFSKKFSFNHRLL